MIQLYVIRHAQTQFNKEHIFQGVTDNGLSSDGLKQAKYIADYFDNIEIDEIYSSPLNRVIQTATPLAEKKKREIKILDKFYEVDCGKWEGKNWYYLVENEGESLRKWLLDADFKAPEGESLLDVYNRIEKQLFEVISMPERDRNIVLFGHGGVNRAIICHLLGISINRAFRFEQSNACINLFEISEKFPPRLIMLNYTGHLKED
ncbi:probable phosphoglycerate mutase [Thermotomaculum hydrothermale]|uniref:Probable phosphoglycerate mutase n=1 Tax=Thermotomaculum hydrothermale TaxID=981385 RepID=A0A7R6PW57_9BACT|nr:histidine phosphatase family protein [Thermotomaculum hydrothermale]BBB31700.1 probable phosphoglycerate mutase [Thermotomaculum hydrothermale]